MDNAKWLIGELCYRLSILWLILRWRPFIKCPACKGVGGEMSGYYEPEWSECPYCYEAWEKLVDSGCDWTEGRLSPWLWVRVKLYMRWGLQMSAGTVRQFIMCKVGLHRWLDESDLEEDLEICANCFEHRYRSVSTETKLKQTTSNCASGGGA